MEAQEGPSSLVKMIQTLSGRAETGYKCDLPHGPWYTFHFTRRDPFYITREIHERWRGLPNVSQHSQWLSCFLPIQLHSENLHSNKLFYSVFAIPTKRGSLVWQEVPINLYIIVYLRVHFLLTLPCFF